ncbi:hypothetical protein [Microbacterium sp. 3J1]|uniref:hypothetical protein n=1 Tax=Microbacterium sp. 3J1 TaxID=861269 RepID=UPI000AD80AC9|nr:hypothetical protein [Microbacterium sp. 3J1]
MHLTTWNLPDVVMALVSLPITSLVIAIFVSLVVEAWASHRRDAESAALRQTDQLEIRSRHRSEVVLLAVVAVAVIVAPLADVLLRSYVLDMSASTAPLRVAMPLLAACLGIAFVATWIGTRGTAPSSVPVIPAARRTWSSFSRPRDLVILGTLLVVLVVTTVLAGLVSSTDRDGRHVILQIPVPNLPDVDPLRVQFYGWTYGIPALLGAAALVVAVVVLLRLNAARPFIRPETVHAERTVRRHLASDATTIPIAALALALAAGFRLVADANAITGIVITGVNEGAPYDATWKYAELAAVVGWGAPLLEVVGFTLLVLVAMRVPRRLPTPLLATGSAAPAEELR